MYAFHPYYVPVTVFVWGGVGQNKEKRSFRVIPDNKVPGQELAKG